MVPHAQRKKGRKVWERVPVITGSMENEVGWARMRKGRLWRHGWDMKRRRGAVRESVEAQSLTSGETVSPWREAWTGRDAQRRPARVLESEGVFECGQESIVTDASQRFAPGLFGDRDLMGRTELLCKTNRLKSVGEKLLAGLKLVELEVQVDVSCRKPVLGYSEENQTLSYWAECHLVSPCADRVSAHGLDDQTQGSSLFGLWTEVHPRGISVTEASPW